MSERFSLCLVSVVSDKKKKRKKKWIALFISFKHNLSGPSERKESTHLDILWILIRQSDVAPGNYGTTVELP